MSRALPLCLFCGFICGFSTSSGDFEWAAIYDVPDATYSWVAHQIDGSYAAESMKIVLLPLEEASEAALESLEGEGGHSMEHVCTDVAEGGVFMPAEDACFILQFDSANESSSFTVSYTFHLLHFHGPAQTHAPAVM